MNHVFSEIPRIKCPRSMFQRNHNLKTAINCDNIYPIYCDEALPADTFRFRQNIFARLATPIVPIMDNLYLDTFYFAVPIRLIWDDWQKFMGERPFGDTTTVYEVPQLTAPADTGITVGSFSDYIGIPTGVPNLKFSALWHRAYNLIWNTWFRDENLCAPIPVGNRTETSNTHTEVLTDYILRKRCKRHDYFTSCLPWPQKGDGTIISLGDKANVWGDGNGMLLRFRGTQSTGSDEIGYMVTKSGGQDPTIWSHTRGTDFTSVGLGTNLTSDTTHFQHGAVAVGTPLGLQTRGTVGSGVYADLSNASTITINKLREAFAIQSLLEIDARGGTRYIELLLAHFGVQSPDARMQRPEYLGGTSVPINITTVAQTSSTDSTTPQGNLAAFGTVSSGASWSKSFTEHCVILGLANVRADLSYQQGLPRMFSRKTRYDFYWPELANLGEQAVLNKEIFAQGTSADDGVFGYQERWAEYRYHPNTITSIMRSAASNSLDVWHLAQYFTSLPVLNQSFIQENVPISRAIAVQTEPALILDGWFQVDCARPMPLYSVPGLGKRL